MTTYVTTASDAIITVLTIAYAALRERFKPVLISASPAIASGIIRMKSKHAAAAPGRYSDASMRTIRPRRVTCTRKQNQTQDFHTQPGKDKCRSRGQAWQECDRRRHQQASRWHQKEAQCLQLRVSFPGWNRVIKRLSYHRQAISTTGLVLDYKQNRKLRLNQPPWPAYAEIISTPHDERFAR